MSTIFVFGSNTAGIHGGGAALTAYKKHGARWGMSYGHHGNSFALPTKGHIVVYSRIPAADGKHEGFAIGDTLTIAEINEYVRGLLMYAKHHPEHEFQITRLGCGLAGLKDEDVAPLFFVAPSNCSFDDKWAEYLPYAAKFWGTF